MAFVVCAVVYYGSMYNIKVESDANDYTDWILRSVPTLIRSLIFYRCDDLIFQVVRSHVDHIFFDGFKMINDFADYF